MSRLVACFLTFFWVASPVSAQTDLLSQARRGVEHMVLTQTQLARGPIPPGYLWTGVALLGAGALYLVLGATSEDEFICAGGTCVDSKTAFLATGSALAGTGAVLLIVGNAKRSVSPDLTFLRGGFRIGTTLEF